MPDQVPEDVIRDRFNRLLDLVQETASTVCARDLGSVREVLVEERDDHTEGGLTGRLSNNLMVHFSGDASLIGRIVPVRLTESRGFYYIGRMEE